MTHASVDHVNLLTAFAFENVSGIGNREPICLNYLKIGATWEDSAFHGQLATAFESSTDNRHNPA
jgi:hypothetical protein